MNYFTTDLYEVKREILKFSEKVVTIHSHLNKNQDL